MFIGIRLNLISNQDLYYTAFPSDPRFLRRIVLLALIIETVQTTVYTQDVFRGLARGFNNIQVASEVGNLWFSIGFMTGLGTFKQ